MTALNKQALIAKIKKQIESFDTVVLKGDEANALLDELECKQTFQQAFFRQSRMYDVVAEAYEEAKEQIANDVEIKARLCLESNSLFDRLRAAERRIAELTGKPAEEYADDDELLFEIDFCDDLSTSIQTAQWLKELRIRRAAGIGVKGE